MAKKTNLTLKDLEKENVQDQDLNQTFEKYFLDYAVTVAVDRQLPNVLDGLLPVHRRILYAMFKLNLFNDRPFMKSARITGEVMGKYHPHGDSYNTLDYLTENFKFHLAPIQGHGQFSEISGSSAAAPRYTEARLSKAGEYLVRGLKNQGLVPYEPNYDDSTIMPTIFPVDYPNLLINGATGIAVGLKTDLPPHNPIEVLNVLDAYLKNPKLSVSEAMKYLKGPDLPTGGTIIGDVKNYYQTGTGQLKNRAKIIDNPNNKNGLIITEVPYRQAGSVDSSNSGESLIESITELINQNKLPGILSISNYPTEEELPENTFNIEVQLKSGFDHEQAKALLFKKTRLEETLPLNWIAVKNNTPKTYNLTTYFQAFIKFRHETITKEFQIRLKTATERLEIVDGLLTIPANIKRIIKTAQDTNNKAEMILVLTGAQKLTGVPKFNYTQNQAQAIANLQIYKLNKVDTQALKDEQKELENEIQLANQIIQDEQARNDLLIQRNQEVKKVFKQLKLGQRKTQLISKDNLKAYQPTQIKNKVTLTIDKYQYFKKQLAYEPTNSDLTQIIQTTSDDVLIGFAQNGDMVQVALDKLKTYPSKDQSRGQALAAIFNENGINNDNQLLYVTTRFTLEKDQQELIFVSKQGSAKRTSSQDPKFSTKTVRKKTQAWKPKFENDQLVFVNLLQTPHDLKQEILVQSSQETYKRVKIQNINLMGASGSGANLFIPNKKDPKIYNQAVFQIKKNQKEIPALPLLTLEKVPTVKPTITFKSYQ